MNRVPPTRRLSLGVSLYKRVFPLLFVFLSAVATLATVLRAIRGDNSGNTFEWLPVLFAGVIGYFITKMAASDLADEVLDGGDYLLVRQDATTETIQLSDIELVKEPLFFRQGPPRVELLLDSPGKLGRVIVFVPKTYSLLPFVQSDITRELIKRVAIARRERKNG